MSKQFPGRLDVIDIKIKFIGIVREIVKEPTAQISLPDGATVRDLLAALHAAFGEPFAEDVLDPTLGVKTWVKLFLGSTELDYRALDTPLATEGPDVKAILCVLPPMAAG